MPLRVSRHELAGGLGNANGFRDLALRMCQERFIQNLLKPAQLQPA
jgi:hypothetical protein